MAPTRLFIACGTVIGFLIGGPAATQSDTRPAPDYFLDGIIATSTAQSLAQACSSVSINPVAASQAAAIILTQLEADGFDTTRDDLGMTDSSAALAERQDAFLSRYSLGEGASEDAVCLAAETEIAAGSRIGALLVSLVE